MPKSPEEIKAEVQQPGLQPSCKRIALIYNPSSCAWLAFADRQATETALKAHLADLPIQAEIIAFEPSQFEQLPERLKALQVEAIWAAGGDGTVLALANIAKACDLPLGVLPTGTMNLMARDLNMSLDIDTALQQLLTATVCQIDMAEVNGHPFLCVSNLGFSTRYTQMRENLRFHSGWVRWPKIAGHMIGLFFKYPAKHIRLVSKGKSIRLKSRSVSITNNPLDEKGDFVLCRTQLDSGKLGVYLIRERNAWSLPRLISRLFLGNWKQDMDLISLDTDHLSIHFRHHRKVNVMNDGEIIRMHTPLRYHMRARSLKILKPASE